MKLWVVILGVAAISLVYYVFLQNNSGLDRFKILKIASAFKAAGSEEALGAHTELTHAPSTNDGTRRESSTMAHNRSAFGDSQTTRVPRRNTRSGTNATQSITWVPLQLMSDGNRSTTFKPALDKQECRELDVTKSDISVNSHEITFASNRSNVVRKPDSNSSLPQNEILHVFVVMHSHVDPGWLRTFEEYYNYKVKDILNNTCDFLTKHEDLRFIWSEMSFLERWWQDANETRRSQLRSLVNSGRLELTGGSWVMTDEATPLFWATIDNIIIGQQWVKETFNVTPKASWSVDPFGHGLMMPSLFSGANVTNLVIGRISSYTKSILRSNASLLFQWAQPFNMNGNVFPTVYTLPNTYYTTVDSCGPDAQVCCQFDLGPSARSYCGSRATKTDESSIRQYAELLAGQYRKLRPYYSTNAIIVPVGDDFFFGSVQDWSQTHTIYRKIFDYINGHPELRIKVKFSTVSDFFDFVHEQNIKTSKLSGDFFPYTEDTTRQSHYWTGFYVHRPHFKRLERTVQSHLHSLDLMLSLTQSAINVSTIEQYRRDLALCQHHDSITGTSKPHVMADYEKRLNDALEGITSVQESALGHFVQATVNSAQEGPVTVIPSFRKYVAVFNPITTEYRAKVSVLVNDPRVAVYDDANRTIAAQILPVIDVTSWSVESNKYEVVFYLTLPSLGIKVVALESQTKQPETTTFTKLFAKTNLSAAFPFRKLNTDGFSISNTRMTIAFVNGLITDVHWPESKNMSTLQVNYGLYSDNGGAYVFAPSSDYKDRLLGANSTEPAFFGVGPLCSFAWSKFGNELAQLVTLDNSGVDGDSAIQIDLYPDMERIAGSSINMAISTGVRNRNYFATDANALYMIRRTYANERILSANFYPAASAASVEDGDTRLTVLTAQPTAVTSTKAGELQVLVDRRLYGDDGKGLSAGDASESKPSHLQYRLVFERKSKPSRKTQEYSYHSYQSHLLLRQLLDRPEVYIFSNASADSTRRASVHWPCDVELVHLRPLLDGATLVIIRRLHYDCSVESSACDPTDDAMNSLWTSLTFFAGNRTIIHTNLSASDNSATLQT
ncbi:mannosidasealphaclass 2Amember 2 [Aphelenchoides avenae]|nr:mannosidasealphaclass 2Amember 2 [Aphelenchus avenae]